MTENKTNGVSHTEQIERDERWETMKSLQNTAYIAKLEDMLFRALMREKYGWDV